jgi:hypothetical protein
MSLRKLIETTTRQPEMRSTSCTSRGSNPDHRILSPVLSPIKVLVLTLTPSLHRRAQPRRERTRGGWLRVGTIPDPQMSRNLGLRQIAREMGV